MRPIRLPEPPSSPVGAPEIFAGGVYGAIRRAVIISNGLAGAENQCIGLVRALGLSGKHLLYRVTRPKGGINEWLHWLPVSVHKKLDVLSKHIRYYSHTFMTTKGMTAESVPVKNGGIKGISVVLEADVNQIVTMAQNSFDRNGPLLVVASGWDTIPISSSIKRLASEKVFVVQIQHPRSHLNRFDLVVTPQHDYYPLSPQGQEQIPRLLRSFITPREPPGHNVVLTLGALHEVDSAALRTAANTWYDEFAPLPKPLLVVNIGGPTRHCRYGLELARQLIDSLDNVLKSCGSLRISVSRRTPQRILDMVVNELSSHPKVNIWDGKEPNPHMGNLAWADAFVVTADSVSMLSEACSTGKPVYVVGADRCTWKIAEFHRSLRERGVARIFMGVEDISRSWSYPPLNDTADTARRVRDTIAERGLTLLPQ